MLVVGVEELGPVLVAEVGRVLGRGDDVGEQHRREHSIAQRHGARRISSNRSKTSLRSWTKSDRTAPPCNWGNVDSPLLLDRIAPSRLDEPGFAQLLAGATGAPEQAAAARSQWSRGRVRAATLLAVAEREQMFSDDLEAWLNNDEPKTLGGLAVAFDEGGFAVTILLLMFVPALPIPTGGITHVFEVITVLLAFEMVLGRTTLWLPKRFRNRELGATTTGKAVPFIIRRIRFFERFSRRRFGGLFGQRWFLRFLGLLIIGFTAGAAVAPPFSGLDTLPALGVVVIALSIILEDIVVLAIGVVIGTGGVVLIITLGAAAVRLFQRVF